jgi:transcriptional regulator with XRE-family HTH domain
MTTEQAFGVVLKRLRAEKQISQEALALESGLDRTFISLLERGRRQPSLSTIFQISNPLGVEAHELVKVVMEELKNQENG